MRYSDALTPYQKPQEPVVVIQEGQSFTFIRFSDGEVEVLSSAGRIITFLIIGGGLFLVQLTSSFST